MSTKTSSPNAATTAAVSEPVPSFESQKTYIVDNASILDKETRKSILCLVMREIGQTVERDGETRNVVLVNKETNSPSINLEEIDNEEVILHVYNIVKHRRTVLSEPARGARRARV